MSEKPVKVFISYSWDSEEHKAWVRKLSDDLEKAGIETILDQKDMELGDLIPEFMEKAVSESDYVLMVLTPTYKEKADKRFGGVYYEKSMITVEVYKNQNHRKFIPVLAGGTWETSMPKWAEGKLGIDFSTIENYSKLKELILSLKKKNLSILYSTVQDDNSKNANAANIDIKPQENLSFEKISTGLEKAISKLLVVGLLLLVSTIVIGLYIRNTTTGSFGYFVYEETPIFLKITHYTGNEDVVIVPQSIYGRSVDKIGSRTFSNNYSIQEVQILGNVISIDDGAFSNCISLSKVMISDSVTQIGSDSFQNCVALQKVLYYGSKKQWETTMKSLFSGNDGTLFQGIIQYDCFIEFGIAKQNNGDLLGAALCYSKAIENNVDIINAYKYRGDVYFELEQYEMAISDYTKAIGLRDDFAEAYYQRGEAYRHIEQYDMAILDLKKSDSLGITSSKHKIHLAENRISIEPPEGDTDEG